MAGIPNTLAINDGICKGTFERGEDINLKPTWASDTYTILFQNTNWYIIDNEGDVKYAAPEWPNVVVVK